MRVPPEAIFISSLLLFPRQGMNPFEERGNKAVDEKDVETWI